MKIAEATPEPTCRFERMASRVALVVAAAVALLGPVAGTFAESGAASTAAPSSSSAVPAPVSPDKPRKAKAVAKKKGAKPASAAHTTAAATASSASSAAAEPSTAESGTREIYATGKKPSPSAVRLQEKVGANEPEAHNTLADVVRATEEARKKRTGKTTVITSETVEAHKDKNKGKGTPRPPQSAATPGAMGYEGVRDSKGRDELWWRATMESAQVQVKSLETRIEDLQNQINSLRNSFYAQDDPAYRDGVIKPKWDESLHQLDQAKEDLEKAKNRYSSLQEEARKSGALPGWLR